MKKNYGRKLRRSKLKAFVKYVPGTLGLSAVSEAILQDFGSIVNRRERKRIAREQGVAFRVYAN